MNQRWLICLGMCCGIWLGVYIGLGYIAAPLLFSHLDKMQAGEIAGKMFHVVHISGLVIWLVFYLTTRRKNHYLQFSPNRIEKWNGLLILCLLMNEVVISPVIEALKMEQDHWLHVIVGGNFAVWHGISSSIYLVMGILAFWLTWRFFRFELNCH